MKERLLSVEELAEYLQLSTKTVYRMLRRGQVPCYRVGNQWRFRKETIDAWLENEQQQPLEAAGTESE